jgi:hypothetical protein
MIGDQRDPNLPKHEWGKWPKVKPETVAPLRNGTPDLYNHTPTRFVSLAEAKARGWPHFWTGEICVTGHRAARYVSNPSVCADCERIKKGKLPIYGKGVPELEEAKKRNYTQKNTAMVVKSPQPNAGEKLFLAKYAELKDFVAAAEAVGRSETEFLAILSWNEVFREAVNRLEESLGITHTQKITAEFDWTDDKRRSFLITYANTADLKKSLGVIGATNVQFHKELAENSEFQRDFEEAEQISKAIFNQAASSAAIKGDVKLLSRVASNLFPEKFGENLKVDMNIKQNLNADQINAQITSLLSRFDRQGLLSAPDEPEEDAAEAEYRDVEPVGADEAAELVGAESADPGPDPNSDLVSGSE